jgi:ACS family glucarate transporter-like MFS transporter
MNTPLASEPQNVNQRATHIRWFGGALVCFLCFVAYVDRIVFSVSASPIMQALHMNPVDFGIVTTLFNVGYFIFQIPGAFMIERLGTRATLAISLITWSVFTALTGVANSLMMLAVIRFFFGIGESPVFPAGNSFFANWFPKEERGKANSLMNAGAFMAPIFAPPIVVAVVTSMGWNMAFYLCGLLGIATAVVWYVCTRNHPSEHPWVNKKEVAFITKDSEITTKKEKAPWKLFLKQRSFWAIAMGYFGTLWTIQFFIYWLPYYLQAARKMSFKDMGFYTSVPFIFLVIGVFVAGALSDWLLKKGLSRFQSRNLVCVVGLGISALALVMSVYAETAVGNILWLSLALGMAGFAQTLSWVIATDIARKFTSAVGSWMNTWGFVAAAIVPTVAAIVARDYGWNQVLILNACIILIGLTGFLLVKTNEPLKVS